VRLLYGFLPERRIVIVWGGTKDQRRLPPAIIRRAREVLDDVESLIGSLGGITIH
jgi:hypothetical protein